MSGPQHADEAIQRILRTLRTQLDLDVAFVSQIGNGRQVVRYVDTDTTGTGVVVGAQDPGTHLGVPVTLSDGTAYGTLCCFSTSVKTKVDDDAALAMRLMSALIANFIDDVEARRHRDEKRRRQLCSITADRDLTMVFQPIVGVPDRQFAGFEALARFPRLAQNPLEVFNDAWALGVGIDLEIKAVRAALGYFRLLSASMFMTVNVSPITLTNPAFYSMIEQSRVSAHRMVIEVTEHAAVSDYDALLTATAQLRCLGVRLAIDDVGMGFSGLNHIVRVQPDIIKLDAGLVRDVDSNVAKQAMVEALVSFAARTSTMVIAEGVETEAELACVAEIGVTHAQGYLIRRPRPLTIGRPLMPEHVGVG